MSKIFVYSDPHIGHKNIINYENRPFDDVDEMTETLITTWNAVVKEDDIVFVLGDVSFVNKDKTAKFVLALNGRKKLILGDHDRGRTVQWWKDVGFEEVYKYPICYGGFFWLSHEPMYLNKHMPYVNIHGHLHGQKYDSIQHVNVCVEQINYTPVLLDDIIARYKSEGVQDE